MCGVGVCAGPGSRLCPALLGWVVGVCFLRFLFFGSALWCRLLGVPVPGLLVPVPPSPFFRAGLLALFFFRGVCLHVSVSFFPVGRCSWLGVAGFGWVVPLCLYGGPVFGAFWVGGLAASCGVGGRFGGCGLFSRMGGMEGDGVDSLWRAMSVIEGGQGTSAEAKEVRARVVASVEEKLQAGVMQEPRPQGETGWKEYVRKLVQGRRMGGPPEVEAWAVKNGYRVKVYREMKDGEGYRKIQEYGGEKGMTVGILWRKTRVYEVVWEHEETGEGSTTGEAGRAGKGRGAQVRVGAGGEREHSVASGESRPSTCGTGSRIYPNR